MDSELANDRTFLGWLRTAIAIYGPGFVVAKISLIVQRDATLLDNKGRVGDVRTFPTAGHFARHNRTAPIETSSGPKTRHRLNPRGDRQLNHAIRVAAVTQVRNDTPGRDYYLRKQAEGKSGNEALRALSNASGATGNPSGVPA